MTWWARGRLSAISNRRLFVTVLGLVLPLVLIGAAAFILATNLSARGSKLTSVDDGSRVIQPWAR